jgi:thioesterase domain-containing protein
VHDVGGSCSYARELVPWIDANVPIYGLSAPGLKNGEAPLSCVCDLAALYVRAIRGVRARGPFRIAGWSAGGTIAYEIARQLLAAHETVDFLGLIDTHNNYAEASMRRRVDANPAEIGATIEMQSDADRAVLKRHLAVQSSIVRALLNYQAPELPIIAELYAASESLSNNPTLGWGDSINRQFRVHRIDADHHSIMKQPHVRHMGTLLSEALIRISSK